MNSSAPFVARRSALFVLRVSRFLDTGHQNRRNSRVTTRIVGYQLQRRVLGRKARRLRGEREMACARSVSSDAFQANYYTHRDGSSIAAAVLHPAVDRLVPLGGIRGRPRVCSSCSH